MFNLSFSVKDNKPVEIEAVIDKSKKQCIEEAIEEATKAAEEAYAEKIKDKIKKDLMEKYDIKDPRYSSYVTTHGARYMKEAFLVDAIVNEIYTALDLGKEDKK